MKRTFRHIASNFINLQENFAFQFAQKFALRIFKSNSIYTFIPKNACSTMRLSLAIENGFVKNLSDFNWIHDNNAAFISDIESLCQSAYTFVILRCPYRRLASAYLDKIVRHTDDNWAFHLLTDRKYDLSDISFDRFIKEIDARNLLYENIHWRPQSSFLIYDEYDDYFSFENFNTLEYSLKSKIGFEIVDARNLTKHGIFGMKLIEDIDNPHLMSNIELLNLKKQGTSPHPKSLYTDELITIVQRLYSNDIQLYKEVFGSSNLLFD